MTRLKELVGKTMSEKEEKAIGKKIAKGLRDFQKYCEENKEEVDKWLRERTCICGHSHLDHHPEPNRFCVGNNCNCENLQIQNEVDS